MLAIEQRWRAVQQLDPIDIDISRDVQAVLMLGGPYPETRNTWLELIDKLDPLAARWLAWAFEAYRITPRTHARKITCGHPQGTLFSLDPQRITCHWCRYLQDLEVVTPLPSLEAMGDLVAELGWLRLELTT